MCYRHRYKFVTFLYKLGQLMPVSNSFLCICKFANPAFKHHKVNYIAQEGISNGYIAINDLSCMFCSSLFFSSSIFFK